MKMYKKTECEYKNGYIVHGDEVVAVDNEVVRMLNQLDTDVQRARFGLDRVKPQEIEEFVPESEHQVTAVVKAETPKLDEFAETALAIMEEVDAANKAEAVTDYLAHIQKALVFARDEEIVECSQFTQLRFDLPVIGNPLDLDVHMISKFVQAALQ